MKVIEIHIVNVIEKEMGKTYRTISKVYECEGQPHMFFLEKCGKTNLLEAITDEEFLLLKANPID